MQLKFKRFELVNYIFLIFSVQILIVILFLAASILLYPGGNFKDNNFDGYSFFFNTLCDLKSNIAINGDSNLISSIFIKISTIFACFAMILFFTTLIVFIKEHKISKYFSWIASIFGVSFGPFYFAVIFLDTSHDFHMLFDTLSGLSLNIAVIIYTILYYIKNEFTRAIKYSFLILSIVSISFSVIVAIGAIIGGNFDLYAHRLGSNVFIIFTFLIFLVQGISLVKFLANKKKKLAKHQ